MQTSYPAAITAVLRHEGGYVNNPRDPGGPTMKGITQRVYDAYRLKMGVAKRSVKEISDVEIQAIFRLQYWNAVKGDDLPRGIDYCVFDFGVNSGPSRAAKYLQAALGVKQDGQIGLVTIGAARDANSAKIINAICDARLAFLQKLPTWSTFGKGWGARVKGVRELALNMAKIQVVPDAVVVTQPSPVAPDPVLVVVTGPEPEKPATESLWGWLSAWLRG